jgi:DNA modification methylase
MTDFQHVTRTVKVADLKPYERNARTHSREQVEELRAAIRLFGFTSAVIVDEDGLLVAGHGRRLAAMAEGLTDVPAIEVRGLTAQQKRALALADNKLPLNAGWDDTLLALELGNLKADGFDLSLTGFSLAEHDDILGPAPNTDGTDEDDAPAPPDRPTSRAGELWILGRHRLLVGDSFDREDVDRLLDKKLADMVLTDPPFAIYGSSTGIGSDIADDKMVRPFFEKLGAVIIERVPEFAHVYVHCDWRSYATLWHGLKSARLTPKNCIVWDKGHFGLGGMYGNAHEFVAFFARLPPQKAMTSGNKRGQRPVLGCANIFKASRVTGEERQHNAAKPVELLEWIIGNSSDEGGLVLDLFGGSGSTLIACEHKNRRCAIMEMEPRFADVILERWCRTSSQEAHLETDEGISWSQAKRERDVSATSEA